MRQYDYKKDFPGVDIAKLICALLIVFTHTYCFDCGEIGKWIQSNLSTVGVPFFFIASGYFYAKGLCSASDKKTYFVRYFLRLGKMYVFWSIITLPVDLLTTQIAHPDWPLWMLFLSLPRGFFLVGSCGVYWYILSLLCNSIILYLANRYRKETLVYLIGFVGFFIGVLYSSGMLNDTILHTVIHVLFSSERNFLNVGLFYMSIGYAMKNVSFPQKWGWAILIIVGSVICGTLVEKFTTLRFMHAFSAIGLFVLSMSVPVKMNVKKHSSLEN